MGQPDEEGKAASQVRMGIIDLAWLIFAISVAFAWMKIRWDFGYWLLEFQTVRDTAFFEGFCPLGICFTILVVARTFTGRAKTTDGLKDRPWTICCCIVLIQWFINFCDEATQTIISVSALGPRILGDFAFALESFFDTIYLYMLGYLVISARLALLMVGFSRSARTWTERGAKFAAWFWILEVVNLRVHIILELIKIQP